MIQTMLELILLFSILVLAYYHNRALRMWRDAEQELAAIKRHLGIRVTVERFPGGGVSVLTEDL